MMLRKKQNAYMLTYLHSTYVYSSLVGVVGIASYCLSFYFVFQKDFFIFISQTLISASILALVFNYFNQVDLGNRISHLFRIEMEELFVPIQREILATAWSTYRWDCMVEAPPKTDPYEGWLIQHLRISHDISIETSRIGVLGAVSPVDGALELYTKRTDFVFRWRMQGNPDKLDINDEKVFRLNSLHINGSNMVSSADEVVDIPGGKARIYYFDIPKEIMYNDVNIHFDVTVRKLSENDKHIPVYTEMRNMATDAEFSLTLDPSIGAKTITANISGIHPLNPKHRDRQHSYLSKGENGLLQARIYARHAINKGSSPKFEIVRS